MSKELRELEEEVRRMQQTQNGGKRSRVRKVKTVKPADELRKFFIGLIMLGVGLFWLFQRTTVATSGIFGGALTIGHFTVPNGTVIIPLFIGILLLFFMDNRIFGWIVTVLGLAIIVLAIIMSVRIRFNDTSMFEYVMMFFLIGGGSGLLLRVLFRSRGDS